VLLAAWWRLRVLQVAALWPGDPYRAHWLMTAGGHIAGLDTTPERVILERWGQAARCMGTAQ
jgi:hypothetical protein